MKQYVYIKNDAIQLVSTSREGTVYQSVELPQGVLLNGVIIQPDALQAQFAKFEKKPQAITLMIDSSNIITKKLQLPKVASKQMDEIIKGEFDLFGREDLHLFDYCVLEENAGILTVLAHAATRELVDSYLTLFKNLKIRVRRIDVVMNGLVKYIAQKPMMQDETFVLNIVVADSMLSLLFENGTFVFSNRSRLLQQSDPDNYAQELNMRLSSLVQFNRSQKSEHAIEKSYYVGLSDEMLTTFDEYLTGAAVEIKAEALNDVTFDMAYLYPYLGSIVLKNDVNLTIDKQVALKQERIRKTILTYLGVAALIAAVIAAQFSMMLSNCIAIETENSELSFYLASSTVTEGTTNYALLSAQQTALSAELVEIEALAGNLEYAKHLKGEILTSLFETDYVTYLRYSLDDASLDLEGRADTHSEAADYVEDIRSLNYFSILRYQGFDFETLVDSADVITASYYDFEMELSFATQEELAAAAASESEAGE